MRKARYVFEGEGEEESKSAKQDLHNSEECN